MKVLITGSSGFIGYHLTKKMLNRNFEIFGIDNLNDYYDVKLKIDRTKSLENNDNFHFKNVDICNKKDLKEIFNNFNPERVINLAAQPGIRYSLVNPAAYIDSNVVGFANVIELCVKYKTEGLVYASSSSVYGLNEVTPFSVDHRAFKPASLYGATKRANELIAHSYHNSYELNSTGLRYFTVYGPWYRPDMAIFIFIKNILEKKPINVFNDGQMFRDFTYIDDVTDATISALEKNYSLEVFNIGNNRTELLLDVIKIIENELGVKAKINFKPLQTGDVIKTSADISYTQKKLTFSPKTVVKDGIPKVIKWYRRYYNV